MTVDDFASALAVRLKEIGYKKNRLLWKKKNGPLTIVFSIQKSMYGTDTWYYCFGVRIEQLSQTKSISLSGCQIQERLNQSQGNHIWTVDDIVLLVQKWEQMYGNLAMLRKKALMGKLPPQSSREAISFLTTVNLSKYID